MSNDTIESLDLFDDDVPNDRGALRLQKVLEDPGVMQIAANSFDRIFYTNREGTHHIKDIFSGPATYTRWVNHLLKMTDVGYEDVETANTSVIEGSFDASKTNIHGSIHVSTKEITRGQPALTVRKQPRGIVTIEEMVEQNMMSAEMYMFLQTAVRGRLNILVSGGSGAGKTTMARALSTYIDPNHRVITAEEIDELHLGDRLPNVVSLTTYKKVDAQGRIIRRVELEDLVRESLRMRADRVWVGETRGKEAYALVKACNSGHDGSVTTMHADDSRSAIGQAITYVMESGLAEEVARDQVARAFQLVVQISKVSMGRRVITEITELEATREGSNQRTNPLYLYDPNTDTFNTVGFPTQRLLHSLHRYGTNWSGYYPPPQAA